MAAFGATGAEAWDNSIPCVTFVSCQQAASGAPKCTICDHQVCGAIMSCPAASDDENVLDHFCFCWQEVTEIRHQECFPYRNNTAEVRSIGISVIFPGSGLWQISGIVLTLWLANGFRAKWGQTKHNSVVNVQIWLSLIILCESV